MTTTEAVLLWIAVVVYAVAAAAFIGGGFLSKDRLLNTAIRLTAAGAMSHGVSLGLRWVRTGHGPSLGFFEVASGLAFLGAAGFLLLIWRYRGLAITGVAVLPVTFLVLGATFLVNPEAEQVSGSLASVWLAIHVLFANLAYGCYVIAFALASAYLVRESRYRDRWTATLERLPSQAVLDGLTFRLVGAGFLFQGVMIASGAVWANEAWGRYWGWDPMEIWSLIAWAVYALYLHLTLTMGWKGRRAAWVLVIALPVIVFSLLGVPVVYDSIHGAYLRI